MTSAYAIFETAIGACGIAWSDRGILRIQLPGPEEEEARARLRRLLPQACEALPPHWVQHAMDTITTLLTAGAGEFGPVRLDLDGVPSFDRQAYDVARAIPAGSTLTYGEVARRIGAPGAARAVGRAMARNPVPLIVPCHRVVAAAGKTGGFSAPGGVATKLRILATERVHAVTKPDTSNPQGAFGF